MGRVVWNPLHTVFSFQFESRQVPDSFLVDFLDPPLESEDLIPAFLGDELDLLPELLLLPSSFLLSRAFSGPLPTFSKAPDISRECFMEPVKLALR